MSRTLLPLTPNTDQKFNLDYAHTQDRDFVGLVLFEVDANEGDLDVNATNEYYKYVNLRLFPRLMDQFLEFCPLEREVTREDRLKIYQLVVEQGEEPRNVQLFARWGKGKRNGHELLTALTRFSLSPSGVRADYLGNLCTELSNEMRFNLMDEEARAEHYADNAVKLYDGKLLKGWEIAQFIEERELWWTRPYHDRYLTDHANRLRPLPELAKGQYGDDEAMMSMTCPPADRTADYQHDDEPLIVPSPVKVSDLKDKNDEAENAKQAKKKKSASDTRK